MPWQALLDEVGRHRSPRRSADGFLDAAQGRPVTHTPRGSRSIWLRVAPESRILKQMRRDPLGTSSDDTPALRDQETAAVYARDEHIVAIHTPTAEQRTDGPPRAARASLMKLNERFLISYDRYCSGLLCGGAGCRNSCSDCICSSRKDAIAASASRLTVFRR